MMSNTSALLENFDLKDLFQGYTLAYLNKKRLRPANMHTQRYQHWDLGEFEDGHILRTADNSLFAFMLCPEMTDSATVKKHQSVSANLQEQFLNIVAHLMAKKYSTLPSDKMKIAFGINHHNTHWTCLLAEFGGLNARAYRALYKAHQQEMQLSENKAQYFNEDGTPRPFNIQVNNIKNFLIRQCHIRVNGQNRDNPLGNWQLPLIPKSIQLRHFDSMGTKTRWAQNVQAACQGFTSKHRANFRFEKCIQQTGNTCGDWTLFNAFMKGVLNSEKAVTSAQLRVLSENITVQNAQSLMYAKKPRLTRATEETRICVTKEARELADIHEAPSSILSTYSFSPNWHQVSRVALGITLGVACYAGAPFIMPLSLGIKCVVSGVAAILGFTCFDNIAQLIYGRHVITVGLDEQGQPIKKSVEHSDGLATFVGYTKPYLKTLAELEQDITQVLIQLETSRSKEKQVLTADPEKRQMLVRYYAKKLLTEHAADFYDTDKAVVCHSQYVDEKQAKKVLRDCVR